MENIESLKKENEKLKEEVEKLKLLRLNQKQGMITKASKGNLMSRAPFGYIIQEGKLTPAINRDEIEEIFQEFILLLGVRAKIVFVIHLLRKYSLYF